MNHKGNEPEVVTVLKLLPREAPQQICELLPLKNEGLCPASFWPNRHVAVGSGFGDRSIECS